MAATAEPFSIRGYAARMRSVDPAKYHPFGGSCKDGEGEPPPPLPPVEPPPRSRWWVHELAAERARLSAGRARGGEAAGGGGEGVGPRKGTKRKGSRSSASGERAKKRRRVLQFRSLLRNKEKTSKPQSTFRLHQHMLHMGLLRKQRSSTVDTRRELAPWKKLEEARDNMPPHENSLTCQVRGRMDPSNDMHPSLVRRSETNSFINERSIEVNGSINYPVNTDCGMVRHATGPKDDIFGDLPLLESSNIIFQTSGDELPTVIEESFITDQSEPDVEPEIVPLKLIHASEITGHASPLDDLVKIEGTTDKEPTCISHSESARSYPCAAGTINALPSISMANTLSDMHLKYTDGSALSFYSDLRSNCGSSNHPQGCFDMNTNCSQEIKIHDTSSATSPPAARIRTETTNREDDPFTGTKSTDVSVAVIAPNDHLSRQDSVLAYAVSQGVVKSRTTMKHLSSQGSALPSALSQGVGNAKTYADDMTSCRSMPASTSFATSSPAIRTRTESTNYKDVPIFRKKINDILGPVVTPNNHLSYQSSVGVVNTRITKNHLSSQGNVLPPAVPQGVFNARIGANKMTSCRSMPAKECIPTSRPSGNFKSNVCHESRKRVDACASLSMENQSSWFSKVDPVRSPASIGLAFMKLPGLERMEISNCNGKTGEKQYMNEQTKNTVRYQKQEVVSDMINVMHGQKKIGLSNSQARQAVVNGYVGQDVYHPQQPTVRLMGKTFSVCKRSKDHSVSNMGKVCSDNITIEATPLSTIPCQFPQKRSFPFQDSAIPRAHLNDSSDFLARIPNNTLSGQTSTSKGLHNQRSKPIGSVSSTVKDCTWNFGSQSVCQSELNKASMVSANSETRCVELRLPHATSIPQNRQSRLCTPASRLSQDDHSFMAPAMNQSSPVPQGLLKASIKEKYQKSSLLSYDDPSSMPIRQPYQAPGAKLSSASIISFLDHGANSYFPRNSRPGICSSLTTSLANISVADRPISTDSLTNTDGRNVAGFVNQANNRPAYTDNVSQQPAKRQPVTDKHDFTSIGPNTINYSRGWSVTDAVGPQILDFSNRGAGNGFQMSSNGNNNIRASSGAVPATQSRSKTGFVAGAKTMLKPGQNLNDNSKMLYPTTFPVNSGVNSTVL